LKKPIQVPDLPDLPTDFASRNDCIEFIKKNTSFPINGHIDLKNEKDFEAAFFTGTQWQLTLFGCGYLSAHYKSWVLGHEANLSVTPRLILNIGRLLQSPWYIKRGSIITWNQDIHFELAMFEGNVHKYIDFYIPK
jgi:hypothetical protein